MFRKLISTLFILAGLSAIGLALALYWLIVVNPGPSISPRYLKDVLAVESPVYYRGGQDKIGVFFENAHRQYLPYERIPKSFINSIIAAEDQNFFEHYGVDFLGLARAMLQNVKAGRVVQGGSTITQQTAKNLYKRKDRSLKEKFKELISGWRLEYHYSKEKILEFYCNQFYVSGNGHGLGVAANYYFDKSADDLELIESAFIAGSVKRPNYYNPFLKKDPQKVLEAKKRSRKRTGYVLTRMYRLGMISKTAYEENKDREVPFRQGQMSYALNTIMDLVKDALAEPEVEAALIDHGIDSVATSGIKIYTTIDKELQERSFIALREELSRLALRLEGYDFDAVQRQYLALSEKISADVTPGSFLFAKIKQIVTGKNPFVEVEFSLGNKGKTVPLTGVIGSKSLFDFLSSLAKYRRQRWSEANPGEMDNFLNSFEIGDLVYVKVVAFDDVLGQLRVQLEKYPELQGGLVVVKEGKIRAMVGGHENRFYNRVLARRLMGSTAKPLVYTAALQLRWNALDLLNNEREAFVYQGQTYFPRPDHHSPYPAVSINWAGVKSENVASVWLLYNLCERLSEGQFRDVVSGVDLAKRKSESYSSYVERIRDGYGILVGKKQLSQLAFSLAVEEIGPDLLFDGKSKEFELLKRYHYSLDAHSVEEDDTSSEANLRRQILKRNYVQMAELGNALRWIREWLENGENGQDLHRLSEWKAGEKTLHFYYNSLTEKYAFGAEPPDGLWLTVSFSDLAFRRGLAQQLVWDDVLIDGLVSFATFELLQKSLTAQYQALSSKRPYSTDILYKLRDFRVLVGLRYLIDLCRSMGIQSSMESVLSFPLGSNVISLLDLARAYETIGNGTRKLVGRFSAGDGPMIIDRIEDRSGKVVYRPLETQRRVVDPETSLAVTDILRNVVDYGTGRFARDQVRARINTISEEGEPVQLLAPFPLFGKTGTANSFRNSAFVGLVPEKVTGKQAVQVERGYVVASYVGYDDNKPMVRKTTRITGSSGALTIWSKVAQAILDTNSSFDLPLIASETNGGEVELPLLSPQLGQKEITSSDTWKILPDTDRDLLNQLKPGTVAFGSKMQVFGESMSDGTIVLKRSYRPYWENSK